MDDEALRKLIEQLHAEIQNTHTVDKKGQELLTKLEADIQELLDRTEGNVMLVIHPRSNAWRRGSTISRRPTGFDGVALEVPGSTRNVGI